MTFIYIIALVILLIFVVLFAPISVIIKYDKEFSIRLNFIGFNINVFSKDTSDKNKQDESSKNDNISISNLIKKDGVMDTIKYIYNIFKLISGTTKKILERTTIKVLTINYSVAGKDSFDTSIKYGKICTLIYTTLGIIDSINSPKHLDVNIYPNYNSNQSRFKFDLNVCARSFFIIYSVIFFTLKYIKYIKNQKDDTNGE